MNTQKRLTCSFLTVSAAIVCLAATSNVNHAAERTIIYRITDTVTYMPPLVKGDREFAGNGPRVQVGASFKVINNAVYRQVSMTAYEMGAVFGKEDSRAWGMSPLQLVYRPSGAKTIKAITGFGHSVNAHHIKGTVLPWKTLEGHSSFTTPFTPVGKVTVWGDRRGQDIGYHTRVRIKFDFQLRVMLSDEPASRVTAILPRQISLSPSLVRGDADFAGNGPELSIHANMTHTPSEARFSLTMIANETGGDTKARGLKTITFYRAPKEPVACSRDAKGNFGPPNWEDAVVELNQAKLELPISFSKKKKKKD